MSIDYNVLLIEMKNEINKRKNQCLRYVEMKYQIYNCYYA